MNLRVLASSFMALVSAALITYGLSGYLNKAFGIDTTLIGDAWKMVALAIGASVLFAIAYPQVRGIRQNDQLVAFVRRDHVQGTVTQSFTDMVLVTALQGGRVGDKIKVQLMNGVRGEGVITSYGGTISPPTLRLTETEYFGEPR